MNISKILGVGALIGLVAGNYVQLYAQTNCAPAPSGLVAWWRAEGDAAESANGINGTPYGGVTFAPGGQVGLAFSFDGQSGAINVPDATALALTNSLTIEGWLFVTNTPIVTGMVIFRGDTRSGLNTISCLFEYPGVLKFAIEDQSDSGAYFQTALPMGVWVHVAGTFDDAQDVALYRSGCWQPKTTRGKRQLSA